MPGCAWRCRDTGYGEEMAVTEIRRTEGVARKAAEAERLARLQMGTGEGLIEVVSVCRRCAVLRKAARVEVAQYGASPAVLEYLYSTGVVPPGASYTVDVIERDAAGRTLVIGQETWAGHRVESSELRLSGGPDGLVDASTSNLAFAFPPASPVISVDKADQIARSQLVEGVVGARMIASALSWARVEYGVELVWRLRYSDDSGGLHWICLKAVSGEVLMYDRMP